jgi:hypothetical protein
VGLKPVLVHDFGQLPWGESGAANRKARFGSRSMRKISTVILDIMSAHAVVDLTNPARTITTRRILASRDARSEVPENSRCATSLRYFRDNQIRR